MAIAYNSTARINEQSGSSSTLTWSHTCNALDTKLIVVAGGRAAVSGITYNGVAMTKISDQTTGSYQYNSYYYLDNPPTGSAYNIVATYSSSNTYRTGLSVGLSGATAGIGASGSLDSKFTAVSGQSITTNITTTTNNSDIFIFDGCNDYNFTYITFSSGETEIIRNTAPNWGYSLRYKSTTTAGSNSRTMSVTGGGGNNITIFSVELLLASTFNPAIARRRLLVK